MTNKVVARLNMANVLLVVVGWLCMFGWFITVWSDPGTAWYWVLGAFIAFTTAAVITVKLWRRSRRAN